MRKQIAAANWKMNLLAEQADQLIADISIADLDLKNHHEAIFAVPFPYLEKVRRAIETKERFYVSAQNCHQKEAGAYTGEVSAAMLQSMQVPYCIVGHSERREYNHEDNQVLAEKMNRCLENSITPIFCCGEPLQVREEGSQNTFVEKQLQESLFHLTADQISTIIIAYEPIWAIGTGKTATTEQAQEIHQFLRSVIASRYSPEVAGLIPILYGGSVKAGNANELFTCPDVDGGLVGGASLVAADFIAIINALQ